MHKAIRAAPLCMQGFIFSDGQMQSPLPSIGTAADDTQGIGGSLPHEAVSTPEARVLAQGAVQLKAQAQNFQVTGQKFLRHVDSIFQALINY